MQEQILLRTVATNDMLLTVLSDEDRPLFYVSRNMMDPVWHVSFTYIGADNKKVNVLARSKNMLQTLVDMVIMPLAVKSFCCLYRQGVKEPGTLNFQRWRPHWPETNATGYAEMQKSITTYMNGRKKVFKIIEDLVATA